MVNGLYFICSHQSKVKFPQLIVGHFVPWFEVRHCNGFAPHCMLMVGSAYSQDTLWTSVSVRVLAIIPHPFVNDFPLFLIALNGICKSASAINKSPYRQELENRLHMNRPDSKIGWSFQDRNMGDDGVVSLKSEAILRAVGAVAIVYAKRRMSVKPSSVKRSTKFWSRRLNGITAPFCPVCLQFLRFFHKHFCVFQLSPLGVQNTFCSFLDSFCDFGHNAGEVEGV